MFTDPVRVQVIPAENQPYDWPHSASQLEEAKRLLDFAVEHAPEDCRNSMIENVPLHRDIVRAWEAE